MTTARKIPTRSEIPEADTWDLIPLFKTEEDYRASFSELNDRYSKITEYKGLLGESADTLLSCLEYESRLELVAERLQHYAGLKIAEDSSDNQHLSRKAELTNLLTKVNEACSYIAPELQAISDDKFQNLLDDPKLANWKISLSRLRRNKPHTLSEPEERLLTLGSPVIRGHSETFSQLTNVDLKFGVVTTNEGEELPLSHKSLEICE